MKISLVRDWPVSALVSGRSDPSSACAKFAPSACYVQPSSTHHLVRYVLGTASGPESRSLHTEKAGGLLYRGALPAPVLPRGLPDRLCCDHVPLAPRSYQPRAEWVAAVRRPRIMAVAAVAAVVAMLTKT